MNKIDALDVACGKSNRNAKDVKLEVHHITFRSQQGSDHPENLITLCRDCHNKLHNEKLRGKDKETAAYLKGAKISDLMHATQMNVISSRLQKRYTDAEITYGYVTKHNRLSLGLPKEHYIDAAVIASEGKQVTFRTNVYLRHVCTPEGDYQQSKGKRSEKRLPRGKIGGLLRYDKVRYRGKDYFVKGRESKGYATLMDIDGSKKEFKYLPKGQWSPKFKNIKRIQARSS